MQTINTSTRTITDALYMLSLAHQTPDAKVLDELVRQYPEHAKELTEFVIALVVDDLQDRGSNSDMSTQDASTSEISPAVTRAVSRFLNQLHTVEDPDQPGGAPAALTREGIETFNPFEALNRDAFRTVAADLDVNVAFIVKLRDRQIDPSGMSSRFQREVAEIVGVPINVLAAHLSAPALGSPRAGQFYKATDKPSAGKRQGFEEAVQNTGLSERQQKRLLEL